MGCLTSKPYTGPIYEIVPVDSHTYVTAKDKLDAMVARKCIVVVLYNPEYHIINISRKDNYITLTLSGRYSGIFWQNIHNKPGIYTLY